MREPAKLIQGGSTPSGTFTQQLLELSSKDEVYKNNHTFQTHQKTQYMIGMDLSTHYQNVQWLHHKIKMLHYEKSNPHKPK